MGFLTHVRKLARIGSRFIPGAPAVEIGLRAYNVISHKMNNIINNDYLRRYIRILDFRQVWTPRRGKFFRTILLKSQKSYLICLTRMTNHHTGRVRNYEGTQME